MRRKIGMVFQQFNLLESKTVYHNIALPLILAKTPKAEIDKKVMEVLKIVELEDKKDTYISQLSGGQKQRVGIARALTTDPELLLCDEATSALDPQTTESILKLLKRINREMGVTILLITHQMQVVQMIWQQGSRHGELERSWNPEVFLRYSDLLRCRSQSGLSRRSSVTRSRTVS